MQCGPSFTTNKRAPLISPFDPVPYSTPHSTPSPFDPVPIRPHSTCVALVASVQVLTIVIALVAWKPARQAFT